MYDLHLGQELWKTEKRNELEVATEILRVATKKAEKTEILKRCKLSPVLLDKYLFALLELKLLRKEQEGENLLRTTDKGLEILHIYYYIKSVMGVKTVDFVFVSMLGRLLANKKAMNLRDYIV